MNRANFMNLGLSKARSKNVNRTFGVKVIMYTMSEEKSSDGHREEEIEHKKVNSV